jgi:hypothetical protein
MGNFTYQIVAHAGLALSVNSTHTSLIGASQEPGNPLQQWQLIFYPINPSTQQLVQASILYNASLNMFAAPESIANNAPLLLYPLPTLAEGFTTANTWQVMQQSFAIRTPANTGLNMNINSGKPGPWAPGTPVTLYNWNGGAPNETWVASLIDEP